LLFFEGKKLPNCQHHKIGKKENPTLNICWVHLPKILLHPFKATTRFGLLVLIIYIKGLFLEKELYPLGAKKKRGTTNLSLIPFFLKRKK
jgi:hypothetical protein